MGTASFLTALRFRFERAFRRRLACWSVAVSESPSRASGVGVSGVLGGSGGCVKWKRAKSLACARSGGGGSRAPGTGGSESSAREPKVFTVFISAPMNT